MDASNKTHLVSSKVLTEQQRAVLLDKATEAPFSGKYLDNTQDGVYKCAACGVELFASDDKYESDIDSLRGWPSFADVIGGGVVKLLADNSHNMHRTEVVCANCGGHLGHLFEDESSPTGEHYCINSLSLDFQTKRDDNYKVRRSHEDNYSRG